MRTAFHKYIVPVALAVLVAAAPALAQSKGKTGSSSGRQYYVTTSNHFAHEAMTACDAGFHMASLFELLDVSGLKYDTTRGVTKADSGYGPPTNAYGWIRTGEGPSASSIPGRGNCDAWTDFSPGKAGTVAYLPPTSASPTVTGIWGTSAVTCNEWIPVWCVQD